MSTVKRVLLTGVAVALTTTAGRADDLNALKTQIEQLQSRVSQLEAQPQASMPAGYNLLSIRDGQAEFDNTLPERSTDHVKQDEGFTLSVLPAADAAPAGNVSISWQLRTALIYTDVDNNDDNLDIAIRLRMYIKGETETPVGKVGGRFRLQASGGGNFGDYDTTTRLNLAYGWWDFAPNWELMAGRNDSSAALLTSWDWVAATAPTRTVGPSDGGRDQMRLTYTDGPLSFMVGLEDSNPAPFGRDFDDRIERADSGDIPAITAYGMYATDALTVQLVGLYQSDDVGGDDDWSIGGGVLATLFEGFQVAAAGVYGKGTDVYAGNLSPLTVDEQFWAASGAILAKIAENTRVELGAGYEDYDEAGKALGFSGGLYWDPVSELTLGVGATYVDFKDASAFSNDEIAELDDSFEVFFGTWMSFP